MRSLIVPLLGQRAVVGDHIGTIRMDAEEQGTLFAKVMLDPYRWCEARRSAGDDATRAGAARCRQSGRVTEAT